MSGYPWHPNDFEQKVVSDTTHLQWEGLKPSKFTLNSRRIIRPPDELGFDLCNKTKLPIVGKKHVPASVLYGSEEIWRPSLKLVHANNMTSSIFVKPESLPKINRDKLKTLNPHLVKRHGDMQIKPNPSIEHSISNGAKFKSVPPKMTQVPGSELFKAANPYQKKYDYEWAQNLEAISKQTGIYSSSQKFKKMIYENSKDIFVDERPHRGSNRQLNLGKSPRGSSNTLSDTSRMN